MKSCAQCSQLPPTIFRSSVAGAAPVSSPVPHPLQNLDPSGLSFPHALHVGTGRAYASPKEGFKGRQSQDLRGAVTELTHAVSFR